MKKLVAVLVSTSAVVLAPFALAQPQPTQTQTQAQPQPTDTASAQPQPQPQAQTGLGGPGESCRARADCKANLKCMNQVCTDQHEGETCGATSDCGGELKCINNKCTSSISGAKGGGGGGGGDMGDWLKFNPTDGNAHPFVGLTVGGGFMTGGISGNGASLVTGNFATFNGDFLFALNGGVFIGNHQLSFEVAPVTYVYDWKAPGSVFEMSANYAYFIPLSDSGNVRVFWPIRIGVGMMAGPDFNALGLAYFQTRLDLIGAAIQVGHLVIDLHLPSFRWDITDKSGTQVHFLDWVFGTSLGYVF